MKVKLLATVFVGAYFGYIAVSMWGAGKLARTVGSESQKAMCKPDCKLLKLGYIKKVEKVCEKYCKAK